ncbi:MAG: type II secretion system GspH family protein [Patescibacteria group bacterium]|nr:type II secretion system GspH family protein [Patescibacteria group bacterium]
MKKGFTLIELLVVIAIIGILSAIVLTSLNSVRANSRDGKRLSDVAQLQLALESYFDACKQYPNALNITEATGCGTGTDLGIFISSIPTDPSTHVVYSYVLNGTKDYCMSATLENTNNTNILTQCGTSATGNHRVKP